MKKILTAAMLFLSTAILHAQTTPIGTVSTTTADVANAPSGLVTIASGRATLTTAATVTAHAGENAEITLTRGGAILVCQTTALQLAQTISPTLLLALDRGALEIRTPASPADTLTTPDFRLTPLTAGPLDLQIRVSRNGDTCLDNRGRKAPTLTLTDAFGQATYQVKPGQHVFFEHGSLREVVDRETTPCGCPPATPAAVPLAEALLRGGDKATPAAKAEAANPFPVAVSEGLAQPTPLAAETPGQTHVQVASTLTFDPAQPHPATPPPTPPQQAAPPPSQPSPQPSHNPLTAIGHFFKRIFVR